MLMVKPLAETVMLQKFPLISLVGSFNKAFVIAYTLSSILVVPPATLLAFHQTSPTYKMSSNTIFRGNLFTATLECDDDNDNGCVVDDGAVDVVADRSLTDVEVIFMQVN
eukprot:m.25736 g.25736  ORF g.25736 m.25736 type:complete len:110 (-) comp5797_c0_seq1:97-426(-)